MRTPVLLLAFALACLTQPLAAQTGDKSAKPAAAQGRINSLSPDEARRAERSRRRATESGKGTPAEPKQTAGPERKEAAPVQKRETVEEFRRNRDRAASDRRRTNVRTVRERETIERAEPRRAERPEPRRATRDEAPRRERQAKAPARERTSAARPGWRPRVGAYVPRGVPLYAMPPGYHPRPRWAYGPRFYRPRFYGPRYVYGPPREVYGAPYAAEPRPPFPGISTMSDGDDDGQ